MGSGVRRSAVGSCDELPRTVAGTGRRATTESNVRGTAAAPSCVRTTGFDTGEWGESADSIGRLFDASDVT